MAEALVLRDVQAGYGDRTVLRGVCAALPRGRICVVLGPGGSGKSTLLRVLAGSSIAPWSLGEVPQLDAWRLPQQQRVPAVAELGAHTLASARAILDVWLSRHPGLLTEPMRRALDNNPTLLVRVARTLSTRAEVLLLDEPDTAAKGPALPALAAVLEQLCRDGRTIVLVTHNLALARQVAHHVLLLIDGIKLDEGSFARMEEQPASERVRAFFTWGA